MVRARKLHTSCRNTGPETRRTAITRPWRRLQRCKPEPALGRPRPFGVAVELQVPLPPPPCRREIPRLELQRREVEDRIRIAGIERQRPLQMPRAAATRPRAATSPARLNQASTKPGSSDTARCSSRSASSACPAARRQFAAVESRDRISGIEPPGTAKERRRLGMRAAASAASAAAKSSSGILRRLAEPEQQLPVELTAPHPRAHRSVPPQPAATSPSATPPARTGAPSARSRPRWRRRR